MHVKLGRYRANTTKQQLDMGQHNGARKRDSLPSQPNSKQHAITCPDYKAAAESASIITDRTSKPAGPVFSEEKGKTDKML